MFFFSKKNLENFIIFLVILTVVVVHNKWYLINLSFLNCYNNVLFWKFSSTMNSTKLNIIVLIFLCLLSGFIYQIEFGIPKLLKFTTCLLIIPFTHSANYINTSTSSFFFKKKINSALLNGVLNIHPWLVFTLYSLLLCFFIVWIYKLNTSQSSKNIFFLFKSKQSGLWTLAFIFIILGSYWSFQELSWGGWWNWDVVELTSLNFFLFVGFIAHLGFLTTPKSQKIFLTHLLVLIFLTTFILVRYNIISSIHAFVNSQVSKTNLVKIIVITVYFITCTLYFFPKLFKKKFKRIDVTTPVFIFFKLLLKLTLLYILIFITASLFLPNTNVNLTHQIEFFFVVGTLYLAIYFSHNPKKNFWSFLLNTYPTKNLEFIFFINLNPTNNQQSSNRTLHIRILFLFTIVYFLKVYFIGYAHSVEFSKQTITNPFQTFTYTNNFILHKTLRSITPSLYYQVNDTTYNFDLKALTLNKIPHNHFYKNPIASIRGFLIKGLFLRQNSVFFLYSNLFIMIPLAVFFFTSRKIVFKAIIN